MRATVLAGPAGPPLSALALGCSQIGSFGHSASGADWRRLIDRALDLGVTAFDTADIYGQGDSERQIGRALAGRRDAGFVITKIGKGFSPLMGALRPFKPVLKPVLRLAGSGAGAAVRGRREGVMRSDFTAAHLAAALDASLRRLRFDHVDVLLLHGPPAALYRDPAVAETMAGFVRAGKAARVGASCETLDDLKAALGLPGLGALQLSLALLDAAEAAGLGAALTEAGRLVLVREVVLAQPRLTPAQAVAAAARRPGVASVVVGTSRIDHLEELVAACV